jgi:hypothetical protein
MRLSLTGDDSTGKYFGTYMPRGSLREDARQLNLTYDFRILN